MRSLVQMTTKFSYMATPIANYTLLKPLTIVGEDALDVVGAIQWYADYIGVPDMEILPDDPRPGHDIAM